MALLFVDGFDTYLAPTQKWDGVNYLDPSNKTDASAPGVSILPTSGRNGTGCLYFAKHATTGLPGATAYCVHQVFKNLTNLTTAVIGFAFYYDYTGANNADVILMQFYDAATVQCYLSLTQTGHLYMSLGSTGVQIGSSTSASLTARAWNYIEIQLTIDPSAGAFQIEFNGASVLNTTGVNTRSSANSYFNQLRMGLYVNEATGATFCPAVYYDDFYILSTTGSPSSFLGDIQVKGVMPTGNGTTLNYALNSTAWVASTVTHIGQVIKDSNGNLQVVTSVTSDAKTGSSAPTWNVTTGLTTTDNHVTWTNLGADTSYLEIYANPLEGAGVRLGSTAYTVGQCVWDENRNLQLCTTAGTTQQSPLITWSAVTGGTTTESGGPTWTCLGSPQDTYLSSNTVGDISRFTFPTITGTTVTAVCVTMKARKDNTGNRAIRGVTKSGSSLADSGTDLSLIQTGLYLQGFLLTDPNTGVAWTVAGINAAEFGVKTTV